VTQLAFDTDKGGKTPGQGKRKVMKLSKETMEQAAKELGRNRWRLEREKGKLPEEERKNASFGVESNKELPQLGKLLEEDHSTAKESWMYFSGNNKWVAVRLGLSHFKDLMNNAARCSTALCGPPAAGIAFY
jgi:hypothetical protein